MSNLSNITSPDFINRIGLGSKKIIHRMLFIRHGETQENFNLMNNTFNHKKKDLNTPLSQLGHKQAIDIADYLQNINFIPNRIIVSRLSRAINTFKPFGDKINIPASYDEQIAEYNYSHDQKMCDQNGEWFYMKETMEEFIERITQSFNKIKSFGNSSDQKQTIIFTHSQVISCILSCCIFENKIKPNVFFHLANGSITCIDIDEDGKYHIQAVNYTKHLENPTGQHSPFV